MSETDDWAGHAEAIKKNRQPYFDVYRGVASPAVGILAYRSALDDSNAYEIPDFRKESARRKYANDHWSPDPAARTKGQPWPSILGGIVPSKQAIACAKPERASFTFYDDPELVYDMVQWLDTFRRAE